MMTTESTRTSERRPVRTQTVVFDTRNGEMVSGVSRDLSHGGIFVETPVELPIGTCVEVIVGGVGLGVQIFGRVVHVVPGHGFGVKFTEDAGADLDRWL